MKRTFFAPPQLVLALALTVPVLPAFGQASGAPGPTAPAGTTAAAGKKELVARILKMQQPGIDSMARALAEQPAAELMDRAGAALPERVAPDKREAVAREIQADVRKYLDEAVPLVQARATRLAPTTVGAVLEERFTEDELRQVVAIIESPVYAKFQQLGSDMQKTLAEKLVAETRSAIEPKAKALEESVARRLGVSTGAGPARPPARPASGAR